MTALRIAAISLNQTPLAWDENAENIRSALAEARDAGAGLVCLPEMAISGYGCEDAFLWPATRAMALRVLRELLPSTRGLVVTLGLPLECDGRVYNAVALVVDGRVAGFACKRHLAGDGLHYEHRWFSAWPAGQSSTVEVDGSSIPVGDYLWKVGDVSLGFEICEDAWVDARPGAELARAGAQLVLCPSASHFAFDKHAVRRKLVLDGAERFDVAYVYCNLLGNEAGRSIYDGDALIAPRGPGPARIAAETRRLSFRRRQLAAATVELGAPKSHDPAQRPCVEVKHTWPRSSPKEPISARLPSSAPDAELPKEEAFARVIALGLFDYLRKSSSRGFVVSLSGGADSAAVATLVRLMVRLGRSELGDEFYQRLSNIFSSDPSIKTSEERSVARLLMTVYQSTTNSSETTRSAASGLAASLGAEHHEFSVQGLVDNYSALVEGALGRPLSWEGDDIALQNIQARVRAPGVWMLANVRGALLLSTSNRSEAAVGYATMDGDTSGGLSPIAGIDKAFLRRWLVWMERTGVDELGPIPALAAVNDQQPTAELRPSGQGQTDEGDLMPYDVLDLIERLAIVQRLPVPAVEENLRETFPEVAPEQMRLWVERFYRLFARNQWKRERYAPSFHVDDANLDPKTWCRFPILSGGFSRELSELES